MEGPVCDAGGNNWRGGGDGLGAGGLEAWGSSVVLALEAGSGLTSIEVANGSGGSEEPVAGCKFGNCALKFHIGMVGTERFDGSGGGWIR